MKVRSYSIIVLMSVLIAGGIIFITHSRRVARDQHLTIILSPHYDDAVLSLGGLLSKKEHPTIVATFFTGAHEGTTTTSWDALSGFSTSTDIAKVRTTENEQALSGFKAQALNFDYTDNQYTHDMSDEETERMLAQDIQALIAGNSGKEIDVYGPAYFTADITHPDHALLHKAYVDVAKSYPNAQVHFYIYEDFPYVDRFNKVVPYSLQKNLENETESLFTKQEIMLNEKQVRDKIDALKAYSSQVKAFENIHVDILASSTEYTSDRCGRNPAQACEVVYEFVR